MADPCWLCGLRGCFRPIFDEPFGLNPRNVIHGARGRRLAIASLYSSISGNIFVLTLFKRRIVIFALAAVRPQSLMGYCGIDELRSRRLSWDRLNMRSAFSPIKASARGSFMPGLWRRRRCSALVIGALSLRTRGVYFIMVHARLRADAYYFASGSPPGR